MKFVFLTIAILLNFFDHSLIKSEENIDSANNKVEAKPETNNEEIQNQESIIKIVQNDKASEIKLSDSTGASPNTLKFARELGIDINELQGSGRGGRVKKEDIKNYIKKSNISEKKELTKNQEKLDLPYEHSEFGEVDIQKIPRIKRLSGPHLVKAWNSIPHVTQHDEIDVTEMEDFRKKLVDLNTREKIPVTPLAFIMKALVNAMRRYPNFNSSILFTTKTYGFSDL